MKTLPIFILTSAGLAASGAFAQSDEPFDLNTIVLGVGDENSVEVTAEDIERQNPEDLQDLYKSQPTIAVGSSIPASQKLFVNGVEETNLSVSIDGSRQNNKIFHHNATTLIDPALLKAVRIEPGVAAADSGPAAIGGSVSYETKDVEDLLAPDLNFGGFVKSEYDSNGDLFTNSTSLYGRNGNLEYLGFFKISDGGLREDGDGVDITGSGSNLFSGLAKAAYTTDTGHRFELSYEKVNDDDARPYRANIGALTAGRPVPLTRNYDLTRENVVFTYSNDQLGGIWDPTIVFAYSATDLDIVETDQLTFGTTESFNGKIENRFVVKGGTVTAGIDFFSDEAELDYRYLANATFNEAGTEKSDNVGIYAQARLDLSDRARLSFGGRADFQQFTGVDGSKSSDEGLSGNISGEYDVNEVLTLGAGYSHVWGGVALAENFIINPTWTYPTGGIESVTSDNVFLSAKADFGRWDLKAKYFKTDVDNARDPSYGGGPGLTTDFSSEGFELGFGYNWQHGFLRVGYANIDTEINGGTSDSDTGLYFTTPIGEIITIEAVHTLPQHGITFGADAQIVLEETDTFDVDTGGLGQPLPSYEVVNVFAEYKPKRAKNLTVRGEINNLFNETYTNRATYGQEYSVVVPLNEPGRSFKLSATLNF
ncbi:MAG: TonB-dependent receptor [Litoreibacter sp.]|uniref:TonB-dependent receptor domain-containing protein n=1 Tax=Litoreibacter sp. TaxID=1969459 RepID=UPI003299F07A